MKQIIFPLKPKGGANCWITAVQGSSHSLASVQGCSCCFPSPNPEERKQLVSIPQNLETPHTQPPLTTGLGPRASLPLKEHVFLSERGRFY